MQRQSLGSPSSKNHHLHLLLSHSATTSTSTSASTSPSTSPSSSQHQPDDLKPLKKSLYRKPPERFIHAIPILAFLCFLILYLSSHHPSQSEMAQFNGFNTVQKPIDSIDEMEKLMEIKEGNILSIRSLRNLQELDKEEGGGATLKYRQLHRKIGGW